MEVDGDVQTLQVLDCLGRVVEEVKPVDGMVVLHVGVPGLYRVRGVGKRETSMKAVIVGL